jgi:hypothetical protein
MEFGRRSNFLAAQAPKKSSWVANHRMDRRATLMGPTHLEAAVWGTRNFPKKMGMGIRGYLPLHSRRTFYAQSARRPSLVGWISKILFSLDLAERPVEQSYS